MTDKKSAPEPPLRLPVKLDSTSNGEYFPRPPPAALREVQRRAMVEALHSARRLGVSRRAYLRSSCAAATVLLGLNQLGCGGGRFHVNPQSSLDTDAANESLVGNELIFDVQVHHVTDQRVWWQQPGPSIARFLRSTPQAECDAPSWVKCFTDDALIREVFMDSDTQLGVLSTLWGDPMPILTEEAARTRDQVAEMGRDRLLIHAAVQPTNAPWEQVDEGMRQQADTFSPSAWKIYPVWGPQGEGWWLTDDIGRKTIELAIELGIPRVAVHKGLPLAGMDPTYTRPTDVGPAARTYPEATFLIYHSGYEADRREGPYDPQAERGVDALIRSLKENGIGPQGNVYAELGSTWREVMKNPDEAAHVLGKLLKHVGEDRILWGTDAIWFGSPQDQIQAFRSFEISPEFQERYGYPALTEARKAKIFGLNAARVYGVDVEAVRETHRDDRLQRARAHYAQAPRPSHQTYGPRTRRDMLRLLDFTGGRP